MQAIFRHAGPGRLSKAAQDYAAGLPSKEEYGDPLGTLKPGDIKDFFLQRHETVRNPRNPHYDLRIGDPENQLYSWAVPGATLPEPGESKYVPQTQLHRYSYGPFQGNIGKGYGAGRVRLADQGKAVIGKVTPKTIHFTLGHQRVPARYVLINTGNRHWQLLAKPNPKVPGVGDKPIHRTIEAVDLDEAIGKAREVQAKIDGASTVVDTGPKGDIEAYSVNPRVTGEPVVHTERMGLRQQVPGLKDTTLRGESYFVDESGQAVPFSRVSGLLNQNVATSLETQRREKLQPRIALFDVLRYKGKAVDSLSFEEKNKIIADFMARLPDTSRPVFHTPRSATGETAIRKLVEDIRASREPTTSEGVMVRMPDGSVRKFKNKQDATVYLAGTFPGTGRRTGTAGGLTYSLEPGGEAIGRVGTGFTDKELSAIIKDLKHLKGKPIRVQHMGQFTSGKHRAPSWQGFETDKAAQAAGILPRVPSTHQTGTEDTPDVNRRPPIPLHRPGEEGNAPVPEVEKNKAMHALYTRYGKPVIANAFTRAGLPGVGQFIRDYNPTVDIRTDISKGTGKRSGTSAMAKIEHPLPQRAPTSSSVTSATGFPYRFTAEQNQEAQQLAKSPVPVSASGVATGTVIPAPNIVASATEPPAPPIVDNPANAGNQVKREVGLMDNQTSPDKRPSQTVKTSAISAQYAAAPARAVLRPRPPNKTDKVLSGQDILRVGLGKTAAAKPHRVLAAMRAGDTPALKTMGSSGGRRSAELAAEIRRQKFLNRPDNVWHRAANSDPAIMANHEAGTKQSSIAVDLDGTLARYHGWKGLEHIGEPVPKMLARVKRWLADNKEVCIFTARAASGRKAIDVVKRWCKRHIGRVLPVTNRKVPEMEKIYDDRAVKIEKNTGEKLAMTSAEISGACQGMDRNPTEKQKQSGNYRKGHIRLHGLDISIENPKGSYRSGTSGSGKKWRNLMKAHYGFIRSMSGIPARKLRGVDGDAIDVFIGPRPDSWMVYIIDQVDPKTRKFDEHKCVLGCATKKEAVALYLSCYDKGWRGLGDVTPMSVPRFKKWLKSPDTKHPAGWNVKEAQESGLARLFMLADDIPRLLRQWHNYRQNPNRDQGTDPQGESRNLLAWKRPVHMSGIEVPRVADTVQSPQGPTKSAQVLAGAVTAASLAGILAKRKRELAQQRYIEARTAAPKAGFLDRFKVPAGVGLIRNRFQGRLYMLRHPAARQLADDLRTHLARGLGGSYESGGGVPPTIMLPAGESVQVLKHEIGHALADREALQAGRTYGHPLLLSQVAAPVTGAKGTPLYRLERDAWNRSGVPDGDPVRDAALGTYEAGLNVPAALGRGAALGGAAGAALQHRKRLADLVRPLLKSAGILPRWAPAAVRQGMARTLRGMRAPAGSMTRQVLGETGSHALETFNRYTANELRKNPEAAAILAAPGGLLAAPTYVAAKKMLGTLLAKNLPPIKKAAIQTVKVEFTRGGHVKASADLEVADTPGERARGLMHRDTLPEGTGMLFTKAGSFWMKNVEIPLDLVFLDPSGVVLEKHAMEPAPGPDYPHYSPGSKRAACALELPAGWFDKEGLRVGDQIRVASRAGV